jgi:hypothetical protein
MMAFGDFEVIPSGTPEEPNDPISKLKACGLPGENEALTPLRLLRLLLGVASEPTGAQVTFVNWAEIEGAETLANFKDNIAYVDVNVDVSRIDEKQKFLFCAPAAYSQVNLENLYLPNFNDVVSPYLTRLKRLRDFQHELNSITLFIPIFIYSSYSSTTNNFSSVDGHFVFAQITYDNENGLSGELVDSKPKPGLLGWFSSYIGVTHDYQHDYKKIIEVIKAKANEINETAEELSIPLVHTGMQGIFNNVDCGRYAIFEILKRTLGAQNCYQYGQTTFKLLFAAGYKLLTESVKSDNDNRLQSHSYITADTEEEEEEEQKQATIAPTASAVLANTLPTLPPEPQADEKAAEEEAAPLSAPAPIKKEQEEKGMQTTAAVLQNTTASPRWVAPTLLVNLFAASPTAFILLRVETARTMLDIGLQITAGASGAIAILSLLNLYLWHKVNHLDPSNVDLPTLKTALFTSTLCNLAATALLFTGFTMAAAATGGVAALCMLVALGVLHLHKQKADPRCQQRP